jgi:hypothetical protein
MVSIAASHITRSRGTRTTPCGAITSVLTPGRSRRPAMVARSAFQRASSAAGSRRSNHTSSAASTPITSSFDTFMPRAKAWCGEALRHAASMSDFFPSSSPLVCGPRRNFPPL